MALELGWKDAREHVIQLGYNTQLSNGGSRALHICTQKARREGELILVEN